MSNFLNHSRLEDESATKVDVPDQPQPAVAFAVDIEDEYSDFGADPEELELIERLLQEAAAAAAASTTTTTNQPSNYNAALVVTDIEDYEPPRGIRLPKVPGLEASAQQWNLESQFENRQVGFETVQELRDESAEVKTPSTKENEIKEDKEKDDNPTPPTEPSTSSVPDTRPPLDRFRKPPKKALSVTDLVSPAWCELQYFYVLSKHGRKRRTPAMKQGSKVHKALEEEVHITVPVTVTKKEDSWGLRIWNIIQGLKTLRETGRTREFEVWGTVGGELVNGIIDELSYDCPDPKLEGQSLSAMARQEVEPPVPEYQASIRDYLVSSTNNELGQSITGSLGGKSIEQLQQQEHENTVRNTPMSHPRVSRPENKRIYLSDVKTRGTGTLPTGSSIRPTIVQLHLYHHLLENMAQGNFALTMLAERYKFDINETFSDGFIAQLANLNQMTFDVVQSQPDKDGDISLDEAGESNVVPSSTQDTIDILLQHNNVASLWGFMLDQFRETFLLSSSHEREAAAAAAPPPSNLPEPQHPESSTPPTLSQVLHPLTTSTPSPPLPTRLSPLLTAHYISSSRSTSTSSSSLPKPRLIGSKSIIFNPWFLRNYLYDTLAFWRGERPPKGVPLSDAWKCRACEFRDGCEWIKEQDQRVLGESVARRAAAAGAEREESEAGGAGNGEQPVAVVLGRDEVRRSRV